MEGEVKKKSGGGREEEGELLKIREKEGGKEGLWKRRMGGRRRGWMMRLEGVKEGKQEETFPVCDETQSFLNVHRLFLCLNRNKTAYCS